MEQALFSIALENIFCKHQYLICCAVAVCQDKCTFCLIQQRIFSFVKFLIFGVVQQQEIVFLFRLIFIPPRISLIGRLLYAILIYADIAYF